jgi:hypothetical protein
MQGKGTWCLGEAKAPNPAPTLPLYLCGRVNLRVDLDLDLQELPVRWRSGSTLHCDFLVPHLLGGR